MDQASLGYPESQDQQPQTLSWWPRKAWSSGKIGQCSPWGCRTPTERKRRSVLPQKQLRSKAALLTLNSVKGSLLLASSLRNGVGCFLLRILRLTGSRVLIVDDRELDLTMQSKVRPRQIPLLKNEVCDESRFPRLRAAVGSFGSSASSGYDVTLLSASTISNWNSSSTSTWVTSGIVRTFVGNRSRSSLRLLK